jgi:hypothetical protein
MEPICEILPPEVSSTAIKARVLLGLSDGPCERCGNPQAKRQPCRTAYADPKENVEPIYCRECAGDYHFYWDNMWDEYNASRG